MHSFCLKFIATNNFFGFSCILNKIIINLSIIFAIVDDGKDEKCTSLLVCSLCLT